MAVIVKFKGALAPNATPFSVPEPEPVCMYVIGAAFALTVHIEKNSKNKNFFMLRPLITKIGMMEFLAQFPFATIADGFTSF